MKVRKRIQKKKEIELTKFRHSACKSSVASTSPKTETKFIFTIFNIRNKDVVVCFRLVELKTRKRRSEMPVSKSLQFETLVRPLQLFSVLEIDWKQKGIEVIGFHYICELNGDVRNV